MQLLPVTSESSLRGSFQIGAHLRDGSGTRIATVAQIKDKPRISNHIPSETGRSRTIQAQEFFHLS